MIIIHLSRRVTSLSSAAFFPHRQSSKSRSVASVVVRLRGPRSIRDAHLAFPPPPPPPPPPFSSSSFSFSTAAVAAATTKEEEILTRDPTLKVLARSSQSRGKEGERRRLEAAAAAFE